MCKSLIPSAYLLQALATAVTTTIRCAHCSHEQMKTEDPLVHNLIYPMKVIANELRRGVALMFSECTSPSNSKYAANIIFSGVKGQC
jgi:Ubiquitin carboxyl-terminal hydrolase